MSFQMDTSRSTGRALGRTWFNQPAPKSRRRIGGLQINVQMLKKYEVNHVIFPRRACKAKAGDSTLEELATATQVQGAYMPIVREKPTVELVKVTEETKTFKAYGKLRVERMNQAKVGPGMKKALEAEKEEEK